jgi:putative transposase
LGGLSSLSLRPVWWPTCRRQILGGRVDRRLRELLEQITDGRDWQIVAKEVMADPAYVFVRGGATDAPVWVIRAFKGCTARVRRCAFPHLRNRAKVSSSPSCFVASCRYVSALTVRRYIGHQRDAVIAL